MPDSPLGRYAPIAATIASLGTLALWGILILFQSLKVGTGPPNELNALATLAFGILIGQVGANVQAQQIAAEKLNGTHQAIKAAHQRLDIIHAPPAENS